MSKSDEAEREHFERVRARVAKARDTLDTIEIELATKFGAGWLTWWLSAKDRRRLERVRAQATRAQDLMFNYVQAISPRDWSSGVPIAWIVSTLSYEDAMRPIDEPLSVVPPLAYGATRPIT